MEIEPNSGRKRLLQPSTEFLGVLNRRLAMLSEIYRTQLTELQVLGYTESLMEVKPRFLDMGFALAFKKYKFIPTPAEIIEQSEIAAEHENSFKGPQLPEPELSLKERQEAADEARKNPTLAWLFKDTLKKAASG
ncbi:MAG: hypothetical protein M3O09_19415 [Acidobacteriota bacterium]|nr:hypothetical protein [Acidobacteriota bacterium]